MNVVNHGWRKVRACICGWRGTWNFREIGGVDELYQIAYTRRGGRMNDDPPLRRMVFVPGARKEYGRFPHAVMEEMGYRLYLVQIGEHAPGEKPLSSGVLKGLGIREIKDDHDRDTYRVVYTVNLVCGIYVLHAFQKKSKFGISTPAHEIEIVRLRYLEAVRMDVEAQRTPAQDESV
jgi:phage-related protein